MLNVMNPQYSNRLCRQINLMNKLFNMRGFARYQGQRHNAADVHIWTINVHVQLELLADGLDVL